MKRFNERQSEMLTAEHCIQAASGCLSVGNEERHASRRGARVEGPSSASHRQLNVKIFDSPRHIFRNTPERRGRQAARKKGGLETIRTSGNPKRSQTNSTFKQHQGVCVRNEERHASRRGGARGHHRPAIARKM